jgi:biopolymer transport protein TolQ
MNAFTLFALQLGTALPTTPMDLIRQSTIATKIVLVLLGTLSLISWAIMLAKWREFRRADVRARAFEKDFASAHTLEAAAALVRRGAEGPFASIVSRASNFVAVLNSGNLSASQVEALRLVLDAETMDQRDQLSHFIPWLATIGSVSPLIGLLGTVLGVIDAFVGIAVKGSGNLAAVAPGVAEALVATAAALTVAIPAVFGYNIFAARLARYEGQLESFGTSVIAMMVRAGRIE